MINETREGLGAITIGGFCWSTSNNSASLETLKIFADDALFKKHLFEKALAKLKEIINEQDKK